MKPAGSQEQQFRIHRVCETHTENHDNLMAKKAQHGTLGSPKGGIWNPKDVIEWPYLDGSRRLQEAVIPSGSLSLDIALGVGGIPRGRVVEIFGPESSGKTTICQHLIAEAQRLGGVCAFVDMEHALDVAYAARCGVDIENLYLSQPETGEQALEIAEALARSGDVDLIVVDSVAALVPQAEVDGDMGGSFFGLHARLMSQSLRRLSGIIRQTRTVVVFTNQLRFRPGIVFGGKETTTGGDSLKHHAAIRLDVRPLEAIYAEGRRVGCRTHVKVKKNKIAAPFTDARFDILYERGISPASDILEAGVKSGALSEQAHAVRYGELVLGRSREDAIRFLSEHASLLLEVEQSIRRQMSYPHLGMRSSMGEA